MENLNDFLYLVDIIKKNKYYEDFSFLDEKIIFRNETLDLSNFNIRRFLNENVRFINDIEILTTESIFNILKLHVNYSNSLKIEKENIQTNKVINKDELINSFYFFNKTTPDSIVHDYALFTDDGKKIVYEGLTREILLNIIRKVPNLAKEDLIYILDNEYKKITLENKFDAFNRNDATESHLNNFKDIKEEQDDSFKVRSEILGNEEHEIYISNNDIVSYSETSKGEVTEEVHSNNSLVKGKKEVSLITFEQYTSLILYSGDSISDKDIGEIRNFENFLFDLLTYRNYLTSDLENIYIKFSRFSEYLILQEDPTKVMIEATCRYNAMQDRSERIILTNTREKVQELEKKNPNNYNISGFVNATVYIIVTIAIGISFAIFVLNK